MTSCKKCIAEYCKSCTYDQTQPGSWRQQVEECTTTRCALYPVRPMTVATVNANRKKRGNSDVAETDIEDEE